MYSDILLIYKINIFLENNKIRKINKLSKRLNLEIEYYFGVCWVRYGTGIIIVIIELLLYLHAVCGIPMHVKCFGTI